ncbi:AMIN-like domain-containing (lipo)protein [Saccharothrix luteola]|uniref:AMIN-like domain-containing (lipo)protein n=1 Tax=Saccharothrix luteola TaxID=2893018 RepID=UPI003FD8FB65
MAAVGVAVPAASAASGASGVSGASAASAASSMTQTPVLTGVRTGRHVGFDRVVLDLVGHRPEFFIRNVDQLYEDGSGHPVSLPGPYFLEVRLAPAAAHDDNGNLTYTGPRKFETPALTNVRAFAITGDFEANLTVGLGMRRDSWHRVFLLDSPTRVVIDVGH